MNTTNDKIDNNKNNSNIQLSPEGEMNSGAYETRIVELYIRRSLPTMREIVVLVFTKSDG